MGGFDYPNEFVFEGDFDALGAGMAGAVGVFFAIYMLFILAAMAFSLVSYVLHSLGLFTLAERRGIRHAWLAWVPVGNIWILGSISDQYQYVAKGNVRNRRKVLLGLYIAAFVLYFVMFISMIVGIITSDAVPMLLGTFGGLLLFLAAAVAMAVIEYMAYYDLYQSSQPNNAVLFLVLSIVFSVTMPFFVFACRKKDLGMPPKKQAPAAPVCAPAEPVYAPAEPYAPAEVTEETVPAEEPAEGFAQPEEFEE